MKTNSCDTNCIACYCG